MNPLQKSFWAVPMLVLLLSACQDDDEVSRQTLLIGTWSLNEQSIEKVTVSSGENELEFTEDEFIQFLAIQGENINTGELRLFSENTSFTFHEDGSYLIEDANNLETISGNWELNGDASQLALSIANETLTFDIQSLSRSRMQTGFTYSEVDAGVLTQIDFAFTFTK